MRFSLNFDQRCAIAGSIVDVVLGDGAHLFHFSVAQLAHDPSRRTNVCGFALFLSLLFNPRKRIALNVILVLLIGFVAKISMASLLMKAPALAAWLTPATAMGFAAGLFAFLFFGEVAYRWRALVATLFVFAGGVMAKLTSVYRAFDDTLQLFNWPYGHLATFANLTSWVHEIWPLAAFMFLSAVFIKHGWSEHVN